MFYLTNTWLSSKHKYKYNNNFSPDICLAIFPIKIQKQYFTRQIPGHLSPSLQLHHGRAQANWQVKKMQNHIGVIG